MDSKSAAFEQGLEVLRHFRNQVALLGDSRTLEVLGFVGPEPFTNGDAREVLAVKRQASWKRLSQMCEAGLIQKRGHSYRITPFTREFVESLSSALASLITGKPPARLDQASLKSLEAALEGLEALYARGRLTQEEYLGHRTNVRGMISSATS